MEELFQRTLLIGTSGVIALQIPLLVSWYRLLRGGTNPRESRLPETHTFLRKILRVVFFFCIILLAYSLYNGVPSAPLVYPVVVFQLAALIIGERDLLSELPVNRKLDLFVRFLLVMNVVSAGILTAIVLQLHGIVPLHLP